MVSPEVESITALVPAVVAASVVKKMTPQQRRAYRSRLKIYKQGYRKGYSDCRRKLRKVY